MAYINTVTNQYPVSEQDIRNSTPTTSYVQPFVPPAEYQVVFPVPNPVTDPITQYAQEGTPVLTSKGFYEQTWIVQDYTAEQAAENAARAFKATVPQVVSPRQFKLALLAQTLLDDVELMIASSGDRALAITYEQALEFKREDPMVIQMSTALGKTEKDIDDFFILAGSL